MNRRDLVKTFGIATTALVTGEALPTTREDDPFMALRQSNLSYDHWIEEGEDNHPYGLNLVTGWHYE